MDPVVRWSAGAFPYFIVLNTRLSSSFFVWLCLQPYCNHIRPLCFVLSPQPLCIRTKWCGECQRPSNSRLHWNSMVFGIELNGSHNWPYHSNDTMLWRVPMTLQLLPAHKSYGVQATIVWWSQLAIASLLRRVTVLVHFSPPLDSYGVWAVNARAPPLA